MKKSSKKWMALWLTMCLSIQPFSFPSLADTSRVVLSESTESSTVANGLTVEKKSKLTNEGWVDIYVMKMDIKDVKVDGAMIPSVEDWSEKEGFIYKIVMDNNVIKEIIRPKIGLSVAINEGSILKEGQIVQEGMLVEPTTRLQRTAMGITKDGNYLISMFVDSSGSSIGTTHLELGQYLLEYGVYNAIDINDINNEAYDDSEGKIVNLLGFVSTPPAGTLSNMTITQSTKRVFTNIPITFTVRGYDENYNPVELDPKNMVWRTKTVKGSWTGNAFTPTSAGLGEVTCYYGNIFASTQFSCTDRMIDVDVEPKILYLEPGQSASFTLIGTDETGFQGQVDITDVSYKVDQPILGYFTNHIFNAGINNGIGKVTISVGNTQLTAYVVVGNEAALKVDTSFLSFPVNTVLEDPMWVQNPSKYTFKASVFGSTSDQDNLLDHMIVDKTIRTMNQSNLAVFAGVSDIDPKKVSKDTIIWNNTYKTYNYTDIKVITIGTGLGGIIDTDYTQWQKLHTELKNTSQNNIIIIGNENPIHGFDDPREGELLRKDLTDFQKLTGKIIYYINANGTQFNINFSEGIRYVDLNGLSHQTINNRVDLNNSFNLLEFYLVEGKLYYNYKSLYPRVEIK